MQPISQVSQQLNMIIMALAGSERIFKLLGLFLVAPAPISQYVLDDGAKFKKWLEQSSTYTILKKKIKGNEYWVISFSNAAK